MQPRIVIIGGGVMGAATACFLARDHGLAATVLERDTGYAQASSSLSASSIRQQFSQPANIALSAWSLDFLRRAGDELQVGGERPALGFIEAGYLFLASAAGEAVLRENQALQQAHGAAVALLEPPALRARWPWLDTAGVVLGAFGERGEGWFDGPALAAAFRRKARAHGARFVAAEALDFEVAGDAVRAVRCRDGRRVDADAVVIAAGAWSAPLAARLGVELPVSARKRDVFVLDAPVALPGCPLVIDPSGLWFRPEGGGFLAGAPPRDGDPPGRPLHEIDHGLFDEQLWPRLAARVPAFEALRVRSAWAGYYEMNDADHNGLAGALPGWANAFTACGFSGHGLQQSPAVGASLAACIAGRAAPLIEPLSPSRLREGRLLHERNVI